MSGDNRYSYNEMSNKVEQADRSHLRRRRGEGTGEVESLRGRSDVGKMGDRVAQAEKTEFTSRVERARKKRQKHDHGDKRQAQANIAQGGQSILDLGDLTGYQPSTDGARAAYENILVRLESLQTVWESLCYSVIAISNQLHSLLLLSFLSFPFLADYHWYSSPFG